jgi:hypothetical protein
MVEIQPSDQVKVGAESLHGADLTWRHRHWQE